MAKYLVIVESPAKVKTIKKFLGKNYEVAASNGHVRDLPKSQLGFDEANDFEPKYITIRGKGDVLSALRREVKKADKVYLATDPDREGEAISWHLKKALKLEDKDTSRITFNEITQSAVKESLKKPRDIDMDLVNAQQARRMLDRMVGYKISPLLWDKIKRGLSAGRVQSVALRMINDRETEVNNFVGEEYWTISAGLLLQGAKKPLVAEFDGLLDGGDVSLSNEAEATAIKKKLEKATYKVSDIKKTTRSRKQPLPYTTSTLQQEAANKLNFSTVKTMRIAQQLYEGVELKGEGTVGIITYLRTDSTRVSEEAAAKAKDYIKASYAEDYLAASENEKKSSGKIQDAHEAIRPTDLMRSPSAIKDSLSRDQLRLYQLIYNRFLASQMSPAVYEGIAVKIAADEYAFKVSASKLVFPGFTAVYKSEEDEAKDSTAQVKNLDKDSVFKLEEVEAVQHFTQPPAHYTESTLVRALEEHGIGRPSTYAPTISTLLARHYITKEQKNIYMTDLGEAVNSIMTDAFPQIVDENFTANMESLLDKVEEGGFDWKTLIRNFYPDLEEAVLAAEDKLSKIVIADEESDETCDLCGRRMVIKYGPHGKFLGCPGFPECRNTKPFLEKIGMPCPECGKDIVIKKTAKGRRYYGCIDNPNCGYMSWTKPKENTEQK